MKFSPRFITLSFLFLILYGYITVPAVENSPFSLKSQVYAESPNKRIETKSELSNNKDPRLIPVTGIILFAWFGISLFLFRIQRKLKKLENEINEQ